MPNVDILMCTYIMYTRGGRVEQKMSQSPFLEHTEHLEREQIQPKERLFNNDRHICFDVTTTSSSLKKKNKINSITTNDRRGNIGVVLIPKGDFGREGRGPLGGGTKDKNHNHQEEKK